MGFCIPFNLNLLEWISIAISAILIFIAVWNDKRERKLEILKEELEEYDKNSKSKFDKFLYHTVKYLGYLSGLSIRQILNPYILFPFSVLLSFWLFGIDNMKNGDAILTLTLLAIIWYSRETRILREEQRKSNKIATKTNWLSIMPSLTMRWIRQNGGEWNLIISNQGKGTALNVKIDIENNEENDLKLNLDGVNAIYQGDTIYTKFQKKSGAKLAMEDYVKFSNEPINVKISFGSADDPEPTLFTTMMIKNPPDSKILKTKWS